MHELTDTLTLLKLLGVSKGAFENGSIVACSDFYKAMVAHNAFTRGMTPALENDFRKLEDDLSANVSPYPFLAGELRKIFGPQAKWTNFVSAKVRDIRKVYKQIKPMAHNSRLQRFLQHADLPSELLDFHGEKFSQLRILLHEDTQLLEACLVVRNNKRLNFKNTNIHDAMCYIYKCMAEIWGITAPAILFDLAAQPHESHKDKDSILLGEASENMRLVGNRKLFYFTTHLGVKAYGDETLDTLFHEFAHTFEKHLRIRLLGERVNPMQRAFLKEPNIERWPLRRAAALIMLNQSEHGVYIEPEKDPINYEAQILEEHCNWFAHEAMRAVNAGATTAPWRRSKAAHERYYLPPAGAVCEPRAAFTMR